MFRLTRKMGYAIEAVIEVAIQGRQGPVQSREITMRQGIPRRYLEQVLQALVREGVLLGMRGPRGGYRLARPAEEITLGELVRVVSRLESGGHAAPEDKFSSEVALKVVLPLYNEVVDDFLERLDSITVADLCERARERTDIATCQTDAESEPAQAS